MAKENTTHYTFSNRNYAFQFDKELFLDDWDKTDVFCTRYAFYDITEKNEHLIPELQGDNEINTNIQIQYKDIDINSDLKGSQKFFAELYKDIKQEYINGNGDTNKTLIVLFGFWVSMPKAYEFLDKLHKQYIKPDKSPFRRIILYNWPSQSGNIAPRSKIGALNYEQSLNRCPQCGHVLENFYEKLRRFANHYIANHDLAFYDYFISNLSLLSQSMGNVVVSEMVKRAVRYKNASLMKFQNIYMTGADIDNDYFEKNKPLAEIERLANHVHVYYKRDDNTLLKLSQPMFNLFPRMGNTGPKNKGVKPGIVSSIDITGVKDIINIEQGDLHRYFITSATVAKDIANAEALPDDAHYAYRITKSTSDDFSIST